MGVVMKWFDHWFEKKCRDAWNNANKIEYTPPMPTATRNSIDSSNGLTLNIYGADGGTVLEFRHYNSKQDKWENNLHVISQTEPFEERVSQAITMEMLRRGMTK